MRRASILSLLLCLPLFGVSMAQGSKPYKVIVNEANPASSMNKDQLSRIFLKKVTKWGNGQSVLPVDLVATSPVREGFSRDVHGRSASTVKAYWQQLIFSGRDVPPPEKNSDGQAIGYVKANANAIGYVSAGAATEGVKVLRVVD